MHVLGVGNELQWAASVSHGEPWLAMAVAVAQPIGLCAGAALIGMQRPWLVSSQARVWAQCREAWLLPG